MATRSLKWVEVEVIEVIEERLKVEDAITKLTKHLLSFMNKS